MLGAVIFLLVVTSTVSGDPVETKPEEIRVDEAQFQPPPLETIDLSKVDLDKLKARDEQKEFKGEQFRRRANKSPRQSERREREQKVGFKKNNMPKSIKTRDFSGRGDSTKKGERGKRKSAEGKRNRGRARYPRNKNPRREKHVRDGKINAERRPNRPRRKGPRFVPPSLHTFDVIPAQGPAIRLSTLNFPDAKAFLIVNTASESEFATQYSELEQLWHEYREKGLQIVAFPSNSFNQEPLSDDEIQTLVRLEYGVTYPVMAKCDVAGDERIDLYKWLTEWSNRDGKVPEWAPLEESGLRRSDIQWNFEKFLVYNRRDGPVIMRFPYDMAPLKLGKFVERGILVHERAKIEL